MNSAAALDYSAEMIARSHFQPKRKVNTAVGTGAAVLSIDADEIVSADATPVYGDCRVVGFGPRCELVDIRSTLPCARICGLNPGEWNFVAYLYNSVGDLVAQGSTTLEVCAGDAAKDSISVSAPDGGFYDISVRWDPALVDRPTVVGKISAPGGTETSVRFDQDGDNSAQATGLRDPGLYVVRIQLLDRGKLVAGGARTLYISPGRVSRIRSRIAKDAILRRDGDDLTVSETDGSRFVDVDIVRTSTTTGPDRSITVVADTDEAPEDIRYQWYLDGRPVCTSYRCSVNTSLLNSPRRLDVVVYSPGRNCAGAATLALDCHA